MATQDWLVRVGILEFLGSLEKVDIVESRVILDLKGFRVSQEFPDTQVLKVCQVIREKLEFLDIPDFQVTLDLKVRRASLAFKEFLEHLVTLDIVDNLVIRVSKEFPDIVEIGAYLDTRVRKHKVDTPGLRD